MFCHVLSCSVLFCRVLLCSVLFWNQDRTRQNKMRFEKGSDVMSLISKQDRTRQNMSEHDRTGNRILQSINVQFLDSDTAANLVLQLSFIVIDDIPFRISIFILPWGKKCTLRSNMAAPNSKGRLHLSAAYKITKTIPFTFKIQNRWRFCHYKRLFNHGHK